MAKYDELPEEEIDELDNSPIDDKLSEQTASVSEIPDFMEQPPQVENKIPNEIENESTDLGNKQIPINPVEQTPIPESTEPSQPSAKSTLDRYAELKQLQEQQRTGTRNAGIVQAANQIMQGIASGGGARIGAGEEGVKMLKDQADLPIQQYLARQKDEATQMSLGNEREMNDANSDISQFAQQRAAALGQQIKMNPEEILKLKGMTAQQLQKLNMFNNPMTPNQQAMLDIYKQRLINEQTRIGLAGNKLDLTHDKFTADLAQKLNKSLDSMSASSRSGLGQAQTSLGNARQLSMILDTKPKGDFSDIEMHEIAAVADRMLRQGGTAVATLQGLIPKTYKGDIASFIQKVTNEPQSQDAQEFVKIFRKLAETEKDYSTKIVNKTLGSNAAAFKALEQRDPEAYQKILDTKLNLAGDLNQVKSTYNSKSKPTADVVGNVMKKIDKKIEQYSKEHNLGYDAAKELLMGRGYKPNEQ